MQYPVSDWLQAGRTKEIEIRLKKFVQTFSEACSYLVYGQHQVFYCQVESHMSVNVKVHFQGRSQNCEKRLLGSSCSPVSLSVRPSIRPPAWNNSAPTGRIFMQFDI
jgi:hypothetical protein